jgi:hypothetical protein
MLGHGSSVFGVIPLLAIAAWRGLPGWRWLGVALLVGIVMMGSWSEYQKHGDPPGNRLTKWSLAGVVEIDARSTTEAILDSYSEVGLGGAIHNHAENFATMSGGTMAPEAISNALDTGKLSAVIRAIRVDSFFYLLPSMGLLLLAPFAMLAARKRRRRNPDEWRLALRCFLAFALGAIVWGLLLFGNAEDRTVVHVSSYALPLLGMTGAVVGLRAAFPRFALFYLSLAAVLSLAVYAPVLDPLAATAYSAPAIIIAALALAAFGVVALRGEGLSESATPDVESELLLPA